MTKRTASAEILTNLILETFRLNGELLDAGNQLTKPLGLTSARWQVMGAIDIAGQPITVPQIARRMGLTRQGVQRIVNDLKNIDMITLGPNIDHKRAPLVSLSPKGIKAMTSVNKSQAKWANKVSQGISERKLTQALKVLNEIREALKQK